VSDGHNYKDYFIMSYRNKSISTSRWKPQQYARTTKLSIRDRLYIIGKRNVFHLIYWKLDNKIIIYKAVRKNNHVA